MHGIPGEPGEQERQIGRRLVELDAEGTVVDRADADLGKIRQPARDESLRAAHDEKIERIGRAQRRRECALRAEDEILRRDRVAVGPAGVGAQVEGVDEPVVGNLPAFGDAGHGGEGLRVVAGQSLIKRHQHLQM